MNICVICDAGWVLVGEKLHENGTTISLKNASVVRKWMNGRGIGGIAKAEYKHEYMLDAIGTVDIRQSKVLFVIPCEW